MSAPTKSGATVGKPKTSEVSNSPLTNPGNAQPMVLATGFIAVRKGYL